MPYARLEDFDKVVQFMMHDPTVKPLDMTLGELTCTLSLLLRVYVLPDLPDDIAVFVRELCDKYSAEIIERYPFSEGYIDYLYGAAAFTRGGIAL